jgi:diguanylate cyclase (GGDEF)-like protein/hemerythrin-like metal-binding protein
MSQNRKTGQVVTIVAAGIFIFVVAAGIYQAAQFYIFERAERNIESVLFSNRSLQQYTYRIMQPTFFKAIDSGIIPKSYYTPEIFSSTYIARTISGFYNEERLKHGRREIVYKLAAENPRNPVNKADPYELQLIQFFNAHREVGSRRSVVELHGQKYLHYAIPYFENNQHCLRCHGRRQDAPQGLLARYPSNGGFNEQLGRIRAIESIYAPLDKEYEVVYILYGVLTVTALTIFGLFFISYRMRLQIAQRTTALQEELRVRIEAENNLHIQATLLEEEIAEREKSQEALYIAKEQAEAANRSMWLLSASNQALLRSTDEHEQLNKVCRIAVEIGGYSAAWVGLAVHDEEKSVTPLAWFGIEDSFLDGTPMSWGEGTRGATAMGSAIRTGMVQIRQDILHDPALAPWHDHARERNFQSAIALPLQVEDEVIGALAIYAPEPDAFKKAEVALLEDLASDLAFGIQTIRNRQAHEKAQEHIHQLAYYDGLTGLPNRSLFQDRLHQTILDAVNHGYNLGIMLLDLDGFKEVNDTLGHEAGDALLTILATRLSSTLRPQDTVSRLGGDEFAILVPEVRQEVDLAIIARKLLIALKEPVLLHGRELFVTASIGIASFPSDSREAAGLLRCADAAMYHAKASGKNDFKFYSAALTQAATERLDLESDLRKALANNELEVYYQPKVHTIIGQMTGAEGLLRWHHPTRGMVPPDRFIGIAEDTGLIVEIGAWVLRNACTTATIWNKESVLPVKVAVNLSPRQLQSGHFFETVHSILADTGCRPEWLELEITESLLMSRKPEVVFSLEKLDKLGIRIAIDDFGTGYSSLSYLTEFPIKILKIDKAFIRDVTTDARKLELVRAIISLGRSLGAELVAEGVETDEQATCLDRLGCHVIQGYFYGKPMPLSEFSGWQSNFLATQRANNDEMARTISSAWREFLTTGNGVIDAQHRELFRQITALTHACQNPEEHHGIAELLEYLGDYVKTHFATEEELLLATGSPDYFMHKAAHDYFADLVHTLVSRCRVEGESRELTIKTNFIAVEWLTRHICVMDRKLADEIHEGDNE